MNMRIRNRNVAKATYFKQIKLSGKAYCGDQIQVDKRVELK
jgi:hypothetical protein